MWCHRCGGWCHRSGGGCHSKEGQTAPNELKMGSSIYSGVLITNPVSDLVSDFAVLHQTVTKVVLEVNFLKTAQIELKMGSNT